MHVRIDQVEFMFVNGCAFPAQMHPAKLFPNAYSADFVAFCMRGTVADLQNFLRLLEHLELYEHCSTVRDILNEKTAAEHES